MTTERIDSCISCILIPLVFGLAVLISGYWLVRENAAERIENDLSYTSNQLLKEQQVGGVIVNMDGRDAILTGTVKDMQRSEEIENIIASLSGIHAVDNQLKIASTPAIEPKPVMEPTPVAEKEITLTSESEVEALAQPQAVGKILQSLDLSGITFLFGSDEITAQGTNILREVAGVLNGYPQFDIMVRGHTDSVGDDNLNLELSQRRAQSAMNYLTSQGISADRMSAIGYGGFEPIASNDTTEGRALNRRIEFAVTRRL